MTRWGAQRIERFELANGAGDVNCFICGKDNSTARELCRNCGAPLALALRPKKKTPRMIGVVGTPGAGKTMYLGMLTDMLSRRQGSLQILARGASSVSLQQVSIDALARRRFPPQTSPSPQDWNWVHCELNRLNGTKSVDLVMPDISGAAFYSELDQPGSVPVIRDFLTKCSAAMILVDAEQLEKGDHDPDFSAMKIVTYLAELAPDRKHGWNTRPVAIVFTKADRSVHCHEAPAKFGEKATPGLNLQCRERLAKHRFFATSLVGAVAEGTACRERIRVPLRIEPRGVTAPMEWLIEQLGV